VHADSLQLLPPSSDGDQDDELGTVKYYRRRSPAHLVPEKRRRLRRIDRAAPSNHHARHPQILALHLSHDPACYNPPKDLDIKIDALTPIVERGFAAAKDDIADVKHELKGDIARVQEQVNSIEAELKSTRVESRLGDLETKVFGAPRR
jgi:hypothetical protein